MVSLKSSSERMKKEGAVTERGQREKIRRESMRFWIAIGIVLIDQRCSSSRRSGEEILGFLGMGKICRRFIYFK